MARRKKVGDIYRFDFDEKFHCYCQRLNGNDVCFFDYYSSNIKDDIEEVLKSKELFRIFCDNDCFKNEKWKFICNKELTSDKENVPYKYHKAIGDDYYNLYRYGEFSLCDREDCFGLEFFTLWTELGVIDRLNNAFFGKELSPYIKQYLPFYEWFYH